MTRIKRILRCLLLLDPYPKDKLAQVIHEAIKTGVLVAPSDGGVYVDVTHPAFIADLRELCSVMSSAPRTPSA